MSWTPQDLSPNIWFDFSDSNTLTVASDRIQRINDKVTSSSNYAQTPTASYNPYTTTVNGLTAGYGAGTSLMYLNDTVYYGTNVMMFIALKPSNTTDPEYILSAGSSETGSAFALIANFAGTKPNFEIFDRQGTTQRQLFNTTALNSNNTYLLTVTGNTLNQTKLYLDGKYVATTTHTFSNEPLNSLFGINTAYMAQASRATLCEFFNVPTSNDSNREIAEQYLANKWGITLDSNHAQASSSPFGEVLSDCNVVFDSNIVSANYELSFTPSSRNVAFDLTSTTKGSRGLKNVILSSNVAKSGSATLTVDFNEPSYNLTPPITNSRKMLKLAGLGLEVTATVSEFSNDQVAITVEYDSNILSTLNVESIQNVKMYHFSTSTNNWEEATSNIYNTGASTITGQFSSLSPIDLGTEKRQGVLEIRGNQLVVKTGQVLVYNQA